MKASFFLFCALLTFAFLVQGQGTFIYDQQSATESTGGGGGVSIQSNQPLGQSFTPALSSIGFIRLFIGAASGTTLYVNLRTNSITGPILDSTDFVAFSNAAQGYTNFFFSKPVALVPGTTYYLELGLQSGGGSIIAYNGYNYAGGNAFEQGVSLPSIDLWFREGIVVPEPSSLSLILGSGVLFYVRRKKNSKCPVR
jgi:hypothetical protein